MARDKGRGGASSSTWLTAVQVVFAAGMVTLAAVVATQGLSTGEAWTVVGLVVLAVVAVVLRTGFVRGLGDRLSKISIGPVDLELLVEKVEAVAAKSPEEEVAEQPSSPSHDVVDLQLKLERKLAYIAKYMLDEHGQATFVTTGSLAYDGYLSDEQARTARVLMTLRQADLATLSGSEYKEFFEAADALVAGVRATVFRRMVRNTLKQAGWVVRELKLSEGQSRPDYAARNDGGPDYRVAPVFATDEDSKLLEAACERLMDPALKDGFAASIVVLPSNTRALPEAQGDPRVVRRQELVQLLGSARPPAHAET